MKDFRGKTQAGDSEDYSQASSAIKGFDARHLVACICTHCHNAEMALLNLFVPDMQEIRPKFQLVGLKIWE